MAFAFLPYLFNMQIICIILFNHKYIYLYFNIWDFTGVILRIMTNYLCFLFFVLYIFVLCNCYLNIFGIHKVKDNL